MTELLVKWCIPDWENTEEPQVRMRYGMLAGVVGVVCNLLLFGVKLAIGLFGNSISVMADAFNNLSDAASSIIGFVGAKIAGKPADDEHPFGHGRMEYIAAFIVAFLVIQVGFSLFKTSLGKIFQPEEMSFQPVSVGLLLLSVAVKLWMGMFNQKLGSRIHSSVMLAASADSLGDVGTTAAVILSLLVFGLTGWNIDGIVGLLVSLVVMVAGVNIARETLEPLIGAPIDHDLYVEISNFVESFDGIVGTHDLIIHNYGPSRSMASIHAEVPNDADIQAAHEIVDRIEREAAQRFHLSLVIHTDPVETRNQKYLDMKAMMESILKDVDPRLTFHDLRMVDGEERVNLIFDLVVPRDYQYSRYDRLREKISRLVQEKAPRCRCIMTIENSYCEESAAG